MSNTLNTVQLLQCYSTCVAYRAVLLPDPRDLFMMLKNSGYHPRTLNQLFVLPIQTGQTTI